MSSLNYLVLLVNVSIQFYYVSDSLLIRKLLERVAKSQRRSNNKFRKGLWDFWVSTNFERIFRLLSQEQVHWRGFNHEITLTVPMLKVDWTCTCRQILSTLTLSDLQTFVRTLLLLGEAVVGTTLACGADEHSSLPVSPVRLTSPSFASRLLLLN